MKTVKSAKEGAVFCTTVMQWNKQSHMRPNVQRSPDFREIKRGLHALNPPSFYGDVKFRFRMIQFEINTYWLNYRVQVQIHAHLG